MVVRLSYPPIGANQSSLPPKGGPSPHFKVIFMSSLFDRPRRVALAALVLACGPLQAAPAGSSDRAAIELVIRHYERALTNAQVDAVMQLYSRDPVFMPEFAPAAVGRKAVEEAYVWLFDTLKLNGLFHIHEVDVTGDLAWARTTSTGRFTVRATGVEAEVGNNEFFVFRREQGSWKIHRYMFNANKPAGR